MPDNRHLGSKWLLACGALSAVVIAAMLILNLRDPRSPTDVATDAINSIVDQDPHGPWADISDDEKRELSLTKEAVDRFLANFIYKKLDGFKAVGQPRVDDTVAFDGTATVTQQLQHADGRSLLLTSQASPAGDEDSKLTAFIANTYLSACWADLPSGSAPPGGLARRKFWREKAEQYGDELTELGISGFRNTSNETFTWHEWIARNAPR